MIEKAIIDELANELSPSHGDAYPAHINSNLNENVRYLLEKCDGGYSTDRYFHFFSSNGDAAHNISAWNEAGLWKRCYGDLALDYYFFAEDIFGNQFGHKLSEKSEEVFLFWVDDGRLESFATDFEEFLDFTIWGTEVFEEMRALSETFQRTTGNAVPPLHHLTYRIPMVLGGSADDIENMEISPALDHLWFAGQIVVQCRALPPGTKITGVDISEDSPTLTLLTG